MSDLGNDSTRIKKYCIKPYYLKELAAIYGISIYRMRRKMKPHKLRIGEPDGYYYEVDQVALIFNLITLPSNVQIISVRH